MVPRPLPTDDPDHFRAVRDVDVLIPTCHRPAALAVTLSGLAAQHGVEFGVVVSHRSDGEPGWAHPAAAAVVRGTACWHSLSFVADIPVAEVVAETLELLRAAE